MNITLKQLEGSIALKFKKLKILTPLEKRILNLHDNIKLNEYTSDDIRFMILQGLGLAYLLPIGLNILKENLLIETSYYEGDLLSAIIKIDKTYWFGHEAEYFNLKHLIKENEILLNSTLNKKYDVDCELILNIDSFNQILNKST
ncbi:MAG TPA: contact-dependent growth inhibition system immunity protein [Saprospiraceae bacterium]|nr:contact-dependent growth inhibition system immunity protein [Saprospiraceae bacterium]